MRGSPRASSRQPERATLGVHEGTPERTPPPCRPWQRHTAHAGGLVDPALMLPIRSMLSTAPRLGSHGCVRSTAGRHGEGIASARHPAARALATARARTHTGQRYASGDTAPQSAQSPQDRRHWRRVSVETGSAGSGTQSESSTGRLAGSRRGHERTWHGIHRRRRAAFRGTVPPREEPARRPCAARQFPGLGRPWLIGRRDEAPRRAVVDLAVGEQQELVPPARRMGGRGMPSPASASGQKATYSNQRPSTPVT